MRPYSWRDDPAVPAFDDSGPVAFMDGDCALCTAGARLIARFDRRGKVRICPIRTPLGQAMLSHLGIDGRDTETWVLLIDGRAHRSLDAMIVMAERIGGLGRAASALRLLPRPARDWLYRRIARNRYAAFGRADLCAVPDPGLQARLLK